LLLSRDDVNPNSMDSDDRSVLWRAASEGHESIVRLLVERGADTNASDSDKTTILQVAASNGHANVVKALLDDGKVSDGNAKNDNKLSPMYEAAYYGHVEVIEELLKHHLDKEILGPNDWRPLHAGYDNADVVKRLLDAKAEVNAKTLAGATALALAASGDYENSISLLLDAGANPLSKDNDGNTPLHEAAKAGSAKVFKQLLEHADGETDVENDMSETPLSLAAADGRLEIVRLLMERDEVNVTRKDNDGYTSLWSAAEGNHFGVVQALLEKVDVGSDEVGDLLVLAAEKEGQEILKLLFDKGARPKNQTEEDRLIQVAFSQGNRLLANGLVRIGVDPDKNDEHGWSLRLLTSPEDESNPDFIRQAKEKIIPPTSWSETDKQDLMELGEENMTVKLRESKCTLL
jgi:ankyrin repeat protein